MNKRHNTEELEEYLLHANEEVIESQDNFRSYMKEQMDISGMSVKELGEKLCIGYDQMKKILNYNRPTKKRDCIIAICYLLTMGSDLTNKALTLNGYMSILDGERNPRDSVIISILDEVNKGPSDVKALDYFNNRLFEAGHEKLDIISHKRKASEYNELQRQDLPYKVMKTKKFSSTDNPFESDTSSLGTLYDPDNCRCAGKMWLMDKKGKLTYELLAYESGEIIVTLFSELGDLSPRELRSTDEIPELSVYLKNLLVIVKKEREHMNGLLHDTRNYGKRVGAGLNSGRIHIYIEQYNYAMPQANEFYLFEYIDGNYQLSISHVSLFMKRYLTTEDFLKYYGKIQCSPFLVYKSIDEIDSELRNEKLSFINEKILRSHYCMFKKMRDDANDCLARLRERSLFIRNPENISNNDPGWICSYFNVEELFDCTTVGEYSVLIPGKTEVQYINHGGYPIAISLDNLQRAFELGFKSIEEISDAITTFSSIEGVLQ